VGARCPPGRTLPPHVLVTALAVTHVSSTSKAALTVNVAQSLPERGVPLETGLSLRLPAC